MRRSVEYLERMVLVHLSGAELTNATAMTPVHQPTAREEYIFETYLEIKYALPYQPMSAIE